MILPLSLLRQRCSMMGLLPMVFFTQGMSTRNLTRNFCISDWTPVFCPVVATFRPVSSSSELVFWRNPSDTSESALDLLMQKSNSKIPQTHTQKKIENMGLPLVLCFFQCLGRYADATGPDGGQHAPDEVHVHLEPHAPLVVSDVPDFRHEGKFVSHLEFLNSHVVEVFRNLRIKLLNCDLAFPPNISCLQLAQIFCQLHSHVVVERSGSLQIVPSPG